MRIAVYGVLGAALAALAYPSGAASQSTIWERVKIGTGETAWVSVAISSDDPARIAAASLHAIYLSHDGGAHWHDIFHVPDGVTVSELAIDGTKPVVVLAATNRGLYGSFDGGRSWSRVFHGAWWHEAVCTAVAFHPLQPGTVLLGTRQGLFLSTDRGRRWRTLNIPSAARDVAHIAFPPQDPDRLYLITAERLVAGTLSTGAWQERFSLTQPAEPQLEEPDATDTPTDLNPETAVNRLTFVTVDSQTSSLYLADTRGLLRSDDGGSSWKRLAGSGLPSRAMTRIALSAHAPASLYAATARGVARYEPARQHWETLGEGLAAAHVNDLVTGGEWLWAATDQGLYRTPADLGAAPDADRPTAQELLSNFVNEPAIGDVREAAIRYAEVHPDKIKRWRTQAAWRALFPTVTFGMDDDRTLNASVDEGTFPKFQVLETQDRKSGMNVSVKWELGDLIWSDNQTSIDVRSKLMVQLRDDLVDEVTRLYFERRRIQVGLLTSPSTDQQELLDKELRVQELTALIDGLTGGYFSRQIAVPHGKE